jgi:hypothetical protein
MSAISQLPKICFETNDLFGWSSFAAKLESFLLAETKFVDGSLVTSLSAPFGSGKTTFLCMWKAQLDSRRESDANTSLCIMLNAWEDDYCGDPLLSLINAIEKELSGSIRDEESKTHLESVREATRDLGWFMVGMANSAVSHWTGFDPAAAGELSESKKAIREKTQASPDILARFRARKKALQRLKGALKGVFGESPNPVFVLVDELDRCRPDFAIHYLETIKHIFDIEGLVFVLAVDLKQLENSARALFGADLNFPEYYRKFAHRSIRLPSPDQASIQRLASKYTDCYLEDPATQSPRRKSLLNFENTRRALTELPCAFRLTPRQTQEAFRILGHMASVREKTGELNYLASNAAIFLIFVSFWKPELLDDFRSGNISLDRLLGIVSKLELKNSRDWWPYVLVLSLDSSEGKLKIEDIHARFLEYGFVAKETTVEEFGQHLGRFNTGRYGGRSSLAELARKIQEVEKFAE